MRGWQTRARDLLQGGAEAGCGPRDEVRACSLAACASWVAVEEEACQPGPGQTCGAGTLTRRIQCR